jgi:mycothiol maleylpyruvate isomerase-like protein
MITKRELGAAEEAGWRELMELTSSLTPEQVEEPGYTPESWSAKDLLAHIGAWCAEATQALEQIHYETYVDQKLDIDALNQQFYEANRDLPLFVVRAECAASRNRMLGEFNDLPTVTPEAEEWFRESGPEHYQDHLPRLREWVQELRGR